MTTAKWTITSGQQQDLHYPAARFNAKGRSLVWDGDALTCRNVIHFSRRGGTLRVIM
jgi:hypothetical protein